VRGFARGILKTLKKKNSNLKKFRFLKIEKISDFLSKCYPQGNHGFPKKMSANLVQPFGELYS